MTETDAATDTFVAYRDLLFTIVYQMLGSASDAEDVLQETWLQWAAVDQDNVANKRAYLVRVATRCALMRLRSLGRRKETYVGPWLPEPLLTAPDVADDVVLAENVSMAMLLVLETLAPTERAVFVLREVFDFGYDEIAESVGKTQAAVRQIAHRAREHVAARRPRVTVSRTEMRNTLAAFQRAVETGDVQGLVERLAPDVVLLTDGGGVVPASVVPVVGVDQVAELLGGLGSRGATVSLRLTEINGHPALTLDVDNQIDTVLAIRLDGGRVTALYAVRNPAKLTHLNHASSVTRSLPSETTPTTAAHPTSGRS